MGLGAYLLYVIVIGVAVYVFLARFFSFVARKMGCGAFTGCMLYLAWLGTIMILAGIENVVVDERFLAVMVLVMLLSAILYLVRGEAVCGQA